MEIARDKNNNHMQAVVIDTAYNVEQGQTLKLGEGLYRFAAYEDTTFNMPFLDPNHERPVLAAIYMPAGSVEYFYVYDGTLSVVEGKLNIMGSDIQTNADGTIEACQIKVEGITDDIKLRYVSYAEDGTGTYTYLKNGINNLPISYKKYTGFAASVVGTCNITITQLPSAYEGALVFDGVDDYGICNNLPILTDYTVICRRVIENDTNVVASKSIVAGNGAFIFEYANNATYSFSEYTSGLNMNLKDSVSYQTKNSYNGSVITVGTANDTDTLTLGIIREKDSRLLKGAIYYFALYNKSLTPEEIEEEKVKLENYWEGGKNELA